MSCSGSTSSQCGKPAVPARLSIKIAGVVFWGVLLVGMLLTLLQVSSLEEEIRGRHVLNTARFTERLEVLAGEGGRTLVEQEAAIRGLLRDYGFLGVVIEEGGRRYRFGETPENADVHRRVLHATHADDRPGEVHAVTLYHQGLSKEIDQRRKLFLIAMGLMFSIFGVVLQRVLDRVLTRPFMGMVETARAFTSGDTGIRFDERREDEFGFLARFFNQALDHLLNQQRELQEALVRVQESEAALFEEKERAEVTLHSIGDAVITTDRAGCIEYLNPVAERLTGWDLKKVRGLPLRQVMRLVNENNRQPVENPVDQCLECGEILELAAHTLLIRENGEEVAIADSAAPIRNRSGDVIGAVMVFHDVGHARKLARQLSYQASHDALTGLYNRREFEERLRQAIEDARKRGTSHAVCYLDLDQFKVVNDTCGHLAGDELLCQLAHLLQGKVRETDVLARLGGDEFGVLLHGCNLEQAARVADELRQVIHEYRYVRDEYSFDVGVSIGVVGVSEQTADLAEVYSAADVACYAAKDAGRNRVHVYQPGDRELERRRGEMRWVARIHQAIDEDRFILYCQALEPLHGEGDEPPHYEVLLRICDDNGREVPPMAFIPAAERYNLMPLIDRWVVERVLGVVAAGQARDREAVWAINISGQSLGDAQLLEYLLEAIGGAGLDGNRLCFEITETAAIANLRRATRFMERLRALGCQFALDDFGSGLSSFAYLKNLEVDYLKIDGSFVRDMCSDPVDYAMVEAISNVGHIMGIRTIAEFVESEEVRLALMEMGVDFAQGYGISPPRRFDEVVAGLQEADDSATVIPFSMSR